MDEKRFTKETMSFYEELDKSQAPDEFIHQMENKAIVYFNDYRPMALSWVVGVAATLLLLISVNFWVLHQSNSTVIKTTDSSIFVPAQALYYE